MTKAQRVERDFFIKLMDMRGASQRRIAETYGITDRQVRRILKRWAESPYRRDTEGAYEEVLRVLELVKEDMEALGIKADQASPMESLIILGRRVDLIIKSFKVLNDLGINFDGVLDHVYGSPIKDPDLIRDVNGAIREVLTEHGVDRIVIEKALHAGLDKYADWGVPVPRVKVDWTEMSERLAKVEAGHESQ
ncbi:MAG: helix-turn-helix domain-containing protein [Solirubrobacterales bacterium]|nr:helix-turn-helix domain-containing protein [Solirubrobacterales bacterium]